MNLKHEYGQYFTDKSLTDDIVNKSLSYIDNLEYVLEPSYGNGQFIESLKKIPYKIKIDAYEIDSEIFKPIENVKCINGDFLFDNQINKKYDLIIGNPPYIELTYSFYTELEKNNFKNMYGKIGRGRINLVHAFLDKSFNLLNDGGVISYLLPSTVLTSPWYNDIRETIYNNYQIMEVIEDVNFKGVSMKVCLLIIKKVKTNKKPFIVKKDNIYQIVNNINESGNTIKKLGFTVGVGQYCWSHYRDSLNNNNVGNKVLYSTYIKGNSIIESDIKNKDKKKYIDLESPNIIKNSIVFPRTTSKEIRFAIIENNDYIFENHIIYITHTDLEKLKLLYEILKSNVEPIKKILNSSNLTKTEVENMMVEIDN